MDDFRSSDDTCRCVIFDQYLQREQKRVQAMAMSLQQEEQENEDACKELKKMLELQKKITESLAGWGLNVQRSKAKLELSRCRLAAAKADTFVSRRKSSIVPPM